MATNNELVQARVKGEIKKEASAVLEGMGLTLSAAVRVMVTRIATEKALPFDINFNDETLAAIQEARNGGLKSHTSVDGLMADLNADD